MTDPVFAASHHRIANWRHHPAFAEEQLTLGEKAADTVRNGMGSWPFVFAFLAGMGLWAIVNSVLHAGGAHGFDPYPYILLNLMLSTLAGLQGAILLIAAKRADSIAAKVAVHTLNEATLADQKVDQVLALLAKPSA